MNSTYVYTYDNAGNRTSKSTYAFTTDTLGAVQSTVTYTYGDSDWGDKLTSYTSGNTTQNVEYDEIGNPTLIEDGDGNGRVLEWEGRNLISFREEKGRGGSLDCIYTETFYTYNADGIRTSKWNDGVSYTYCLEGSRIIVETVVDSEFEYELFYLYDANGSPIGMQYREPSMAQDVFYTYWFEKNLQGDIVAVYNDSGVKIITYTYDAWGNFTGNWIYASGTNIYAMYNPFRYRGYYYDTETGFYYLNSRYYNPQWGRFLNADGYVSTGTGLLGYNMFAYCNNNPVMYVDPDGEFPFLILAIVVVAAVFVADIIVSATTGNAIIGPSKEESYTRNIHNQEPTEKELYDIVNGIDNHGWIMQKDSDNIYHKNTDGVQGTEAIYNRKFLNGNSEVIICYDEHNQTTPYIVRDSANRGTYNYVVPNGPFGLIGHWVKDVYPYWKYGNSPDDNTPWVRRVWGNR